MVSQDSVEEKCIKLNERFCEDARCTNKIRGDAHRVIAETILYFLENLDEFDFVVKCRIYQAIIAFKIGWYYLLTSCLMDTFDDREDWDVTSFEKGPHMNLNLDKLSIILNDVYKNYT